MTEFKTCLSPACSACEEIRRQREQLAGLRETLLDGLEKILDSYPQVSSTAVQAGVIGDFDELLISILPTQAVDEETS